MYVQWRHTIHRLLVLAAVAVVGLTVSAVPAQAAYKSVTQCHLLKGKETDDTYLRGCPWVEWSGTSSGRHLEIGPMVEIGSRFQTMFGAHKVKRCAMKLYGKFSNPAGATWDIPQTGYPCTSKLDGGSIQKTHLDTDTSADSVLMNICVYLYFYDDGDGVPQCATATSWVSAYN